MKLVTLVPLLVFVGAAFSGCTFFQKGVKEDVAVYSFPSGADVRSQGRFVGQTPAMIPMHRKIPHTIVLNKDGYREHRQDIFPIRNAAGHGFVQFGLLEDLGYYYDLAPNPVEIQMMPSIVPFSRGPDPYNEMAEKVMRTDERREQGEIGPVEHRYIVEKIIDFYTR